MQSKSSGAASSSSSSSSVKIVGSGAPRAKKMTANERLYQGAAARKERRQAKINESIVSEDQMLASGR
jgi:hypothetical protein